jgi:two-component system response regulator FlrC
MSAILVVDDEAAMREFYCRALAAGGYRTVDVRTAEEALDHLTMTPDIQVVVADLNMPGHGGAWLIEQMRQRFPNVAVILATADERVSGTVSLQPSVVSYLVKPIGAEEMVNAVSAALAGAQQGSANREPTAADPIDSWLDRKLTHPHGDDHGRKK